MAPEEVFTCEICGESFERQASFAEHKVKTHQHHNPKESGASL